MRLCLSGLMLGFVSVWCGHAAAGPSAAEQACIDNLNQAVGQRSDIKFMRNGAEYDSSQAAEFLRGKLKWRFGKVNAVQDSIDQIGSVSSTSGEVYEVRMSDGRVIPSSEFLRLELERIEGKR